ncbi:MAG: hypothetical protein F6K21_22440 [Symploca sp. SIO2D2]|nr:hypothetical protein [Symploca sp. SIO2D2]
MSKNNRVAIAAYLLLLFCIMEKLCACSLYVEEADRLFSLLHQQDATFINWQDASSTKHFF